MTERDGLKTGYLTSFRAANGRFPLFKLYYFSSTNGNFMINVHLKPNTRLLCNFIGETSQFTMKIRQMTERDDREGWGGGTQDGGTIKGK